MKTGIMFCVLMALIIFLAIPANAGPYPPAAGEPGSTAVSKDDPAFVAWATGSEITNPAQMYTILFNPDEALGQGRGRGNIGHRFPGNGGSITLTFDHPDTQTEMDGTLLSSRIRLTTLS